MQRSLASRVLMTSLVSGCLISPSVAEEKCKCGAAKAETMIGAVKSHQAKFIGAKANTGIVTHSIRNGQQMLTLSDDFKIPDAPAPHWQVIDSNGNVYLLQRLTIKDDKFNKSITLPGYISNVAKVQIWCAYAESLLGEAAF